MEQVCYGDGRPLSRPRRARVAGREGARARGGCRGSATRCSRPSAPFRPSNSTPAARWRPFGTRTPTTSWTSPSEVAADMRGPGNVRPCSAPERDNANTLAAIHWLTTCARGGRRGGAREGAAALRPPELVLAHRRPAPHRARCLLDELLALAADRPPAAAARSRSSRPAWSPRRPASGSARWASGRRATRMAGRSARARSPPRASWVWATATWRRAH